MGLFSSSSDNLKVGDKVRVKYRNQEGYIIDKNGDLLYGFNKWWSICGFLFSWSTWKDLVILKSSKL